MTTIRIGQTDETVLLLDADGLWLLDRATGKSGPLAAMESLARGNTDTLDEQFPYMAADTSPEAYEKIAGAADVIAERAPDGTITVHTGLMSNPARLIFGLPIREPDMPQVVQSDGTLEARDPAQRSQTGALTKSGP